MGYATRENIEDLYGTDTLTAVATRGNAVDDEVIDSAIDTASSEVDSYLSARYSIPLDPCPPYIRQITVDIAIYRMALYDDARTTEMRLRYEDAIKYLTTVSKGLANIDTGAGGQGTSGGGDGGATGEIGSKAYVQTLVRS